MPPPASRIRWSMRWPSLETNHLLVSQNVRVPVATSAPCSRLAPGAAARRSALPESVTTGLLQLATTGSAGTMRAARIGTRALAAAISAACSPARRAPPSRSEVAKKPQLEPTRARTPIPTSLVRVVSAISPLRASMRSALRDIRRASAQVAPAASAASTAAVAVSSSVTARPYLLVDFDREQPDHLRRDPLRPRAPRPVAAPAAHAASDGCRHRRDLRAVEPARAPPGRAHLRR